MAKQKNYNNYVEIVGNVANVYQKSEKTGEMRFTLASHHSYTKKDGTKGSDTDFINVLVRPGRRYAKQDVVTKGAFLRVIGHLENNAYRTESGEWKGGVEINADKITVLKAREDGKVENTETGEVETIEAEATQE
jgi:single-stranded DNA-binding protein